MAVARCENSNELRFNLRALLTHGSVGATIIRLAFIHFHLLLLST